MDVDYKNFSDMDSKPDRMYQTGNIYICAAINHIYSKCNLNIPHFMEFIIFISKDKMGKINCAFPHTVTSTV
jgi:hypothetical protein